MRNFPNDDLLTLLSDEEASFRMLAMHFLSEGYAQHDDILDSVLACWDRLGAAIAFPEFPMLSYVHVPAARVAECCERAAGMAAGRKLTDPVARCAGKLLEQLVRLPAAELKPHVAEIVRAAGRSKIFFRVDPVGLRQRVELLGLGADALAERLDNAIESLSLDPNNASAFQLGLNALEVLCSQHPQTMDLARLLAYRPPDNGASAISFQLTMHSLVQSPQAGIEPSLAQHLSDPREAIHANATEALVRMGTATAAATFVVQFPKADSHARLWLARGLQRVRADGLAEEIARLRFSTVDPALWLMLLVAEVRQFDVKSMQSLVEEISRVATYSGALIDALNVYSRIHEGATGARALQQAFMTYLQCINQDIREKLTEQRQTLQESTLRKPDQ